MEILRATILRNKTVIHCEKILQDAEKNRVYRQEKEMSVELKVMSASVCECMDLTLLSRYSILFS